MLPFVLPMWETDATLRAAIEESLQASVADLGSIGALSGFDLSFDAQALDPMALHVVRLHAAYARLVTLGGAYTAPTDDLAAELTATSTFLTTPLASFTLTTEASLATTYGIRADNELLLRDPFTFGQRLEYGVGADADYSIQVAPRDSLDFEAGYLQAGAIAADVASAVGVDSHEVHTDASIDHELDPRDSIGPSASYVFTHYDHALLDVWLRRGQADIHAGTLSMALSRKLSTRLTGSASAGVTVATPMPILKADGPVVAPALGASFSFLGPRYRITGKYAYAYTSLGPRIGYGQQHQATVRVAVQPLDGARFRDFTFTAIGRFAHGGAPVGADPPVFDGMIPPAPATGSLTTTRFAAGARVELPIVRGLAWTSGVDLEYVRGLFTPAPPTGQPGNQLQLILSFGIAGTLSTDPKRTVRRDPQAELEEAGRRARPEPAEEAPAPADPQQPEPP